MTQAIEITGWAPNRSARELRLGQSHTIVLINTAPHQYAVASIQSAAQRTILAEGFVSLSIGADERDPRTVLGAAQQAVRAQPAAIAIVGSPHVGIACLRAAGWTGAIGTAHELEPGTGLSLVDQRAAAALAADHLIGQGHSRLLLISGPSTSVDARERDAGWQNAVSGRSVSNAFAQGDWSAATGYAGMAKALQSNGNITAVFAANDEMAIGAMAAAREAGLVPGQDVAFVGCDDTPTSRYVEPPLSSLGQDPSAVGHLLIRRALGKSDRKRVETRLIVRESSAFVASSHGAKALKS